MLSEIERFEPVMAEAAKAAVAAITRDLDFMRLAAEPFARAPMKSIDYAVMERTKLAAVVPADLGWSDVGSWNSVWDVLDHDAAGNATAGPVVVMDSRNSFVSSDESVLTAVVGLDDVIVVSTADAVLVASRSKAEQVKALVEELKTHNYCAAVEHRRIYRPWGYYQDVDIAARYRVKRIVVKPGSTLSLQKHFHRSEHWVVVKGTAEVTIRNDVRNVHENESEHSSACQSGQDSARIDRGAGRKLPRRGRHRAARRRLWPRVVAREMSTTKIQEKGQAYGPASEDRPRISLRIPPSVEGSQEHH
jgi:mannose-1-phosphate guanylyltransferase/mannose-6-phosphate isomerase